MTFAMCEHQAMAIEMVSFLSKQDGSFHSFTIANENDHRKFVSFPNKHRELSHSYVNVYQRVSLNDATCNFALH